MVKLHEDCAIGAPDSMSFVVVYARIVRSTNICKDKVRWSKDRSYIKVEASQTGKGKYTTHIMILLNLLVMFGMISES